MLLIVSNRLNKNSLKVPMHLLKTNDKADSKSDYHIKKKYQIEHKSNLVKLQFIKSHFIFGVESSHLSESKSD